MIRILLADDHTVMRESLVALLDACAGLQVIAQAADGASAIAQALALRPDVVLVDISMPGLNGIEVVRRLGAELPRTRCIVLTMHEEEEYVLHMLRAGACGYLPKHAATAELIAAIKSVAAGGMHFGAGASAILASQARRPGALPDDPYGALSVREREVFHLIVDGHTTKEIARTLGIGVKTAENHRSRVLAKLDVRNSAELVRYAARKHLLD